MSSPSSYSSITINTTSAAAETAKIEMEAAREEVTQGEKEINEVKTALRRIASAPDGQDEAPNTLEIAVLKVRTWLNVIHMIMIISCMCEMAAFVIQSR